MFNTKECGHWGVGQLAHKGRRKREFLFSKKDARKPGGGEEPGKTRKKIERRDVELKDLTNNPRSMLY